MPDLTLLGSYFGVIAHGWFGAMSGFIGVLLFVIGVVYILLGRSVGPVVMFILSGLGIGLSGYEAWRVEYLKNISVAVFSTKIDARTYGTGEAIDAVFVFNNNTTRNLTIEEPLLLRLYANGGEYNNTDKLIGFCKDALWPPSQSPPIQDLPTDRDRSVFYHYMRPTKSAVDGSPTAGAPFVVEGGKTKVFSAEFVAQAIDEDKYNSIAICPTIKYMDQEGKEAGIRCQSAVYLKQDVSNKLFESHSHVVARTENRFQFLPTLNTTACATFRP